MALYFTLTPRVDPEHGPMSLGDIDAGICQYLNRDVHPKRYVHWWFDFIGFKLADGNSWSEVRRRLIEVFMDSRFKNSEHGFDDERLSLDILIICQWLEDNYIVNSWWGR